MCPGPWGILLCWGSSNPDTAVDNEMEEVGKQSKSYHCWEQSLVSRTWRSIHHFTWKHDTAGKSGGSQPKEVEVNEFTQQNGLFMEWGIKVVLSVVCLSPSLAFSNRDNLCFPQPTFLWTCLPGTYPKPKFISEGVEVVAKVFLSPSCSEAMCSLPNIMLPTGAPLRFNLSSQISQTIAVGSGPTLFFMVLQSIWCCSLLLSLMPVGHVQLTKEDIYPWSSVMAPLRFFLHASCERNVPIFSFEVLASNAVHGSASQTDNSTAPKPGPSFHSAYTKACKAWCLI